MSKQKFKEFYRASGVLTLNSMATADPKIIKRLPVSSMIHYLGDPEVPGIDPSDPLLKGYSQPVVIYNVKEFAEEHQVGNKKEVNLASKMSEFKRLNRGFKVLNDLKTISVVTADQLIAVDYSWLDSIYKTPETKVFSFKKTESLLYTVIDTIKKLSSITDRNHFVVLEVPTELTSKSILDNKSTADQPALSTAFFGRDEQLLRHMWLFLNPDLTSSSIFNEVSDDVLRKITFIFKMYDGSYEILNLGYLKSFVKGSANLTYNTSIQTKPFTDVQKYYLRSMMSLQTFNIDGTTSEEQELALSQKDKELAQVDESEEEGSELDQRFLQELQLDEVAPSARSEFEYQSISPETKAKRGTDQTTSEDVVDQIDETTQENVDKDIQALEEVVKRRTINKLTPGQKASDTPETPEESESGYTSSIPQSAEALKETLFARREPTDILEKALDKMALEGSISSSEFRRKKKLVQESGNQPDPYGGPGTIKEFSKVTKKDLEIDPADTVMNVPATVIDKTMAVSSLRTFGSKYNTEIIRKDILGAVQAAQRMGVIIKNHDVEEITTSQGSYEIHTLEIVPLKGQPSVVRARIPKVREDGTYVAKGSVYALRGQRIDRPIRKIDATRVGLTSYYGKTFVDRGTKKANSSMAYLLTHLEKATISPTEHLRDVSPGDVFDNYFEAPYYYSGISEKFSSLKAGNYQLDFDHKGFRSKLDAALLKLAEKDGARVVGHTLTGKKKLLVMDKDDRLHEFDSAGHVDVGDIYEVLGVNESLAPVDFAEVKVYRKGIPVGIFLGRQIGFRGLVKALGAKHHIVEGKQRKNLQPYEYVVQFKDYSYIFDTREKVNTLVLAGFTDMSKLTKLFQAEMFDTPDVYTRILELSGLNSSYITEMDNMRDGFVDNITERVLQELGEPTEFNGLLLRSCELLTKYTYPASQDLDYQRIHGYARFAGLFYKELMGATRSFRQRNRTGRAKVDMSPFQVWTTLTRDAAVKQMEDINPIQALKISQEAVTYVGEGGRGKESMNRESRAFLPSDMGVTSEATVDSSDVGVNIFLSADPGFSSLDGMKKNDVQINATNLLSTSALLTPFSTNDD